MLEKYHTGAFGKDALNQWSCCKKAGRTADGCVPTTTKLYEIVPPRIRSAVYYSTSRSSRIKFDYEVSSMSVPAGTYWPSESNEHLLSLPQSEPNSYVTFEKKPAQDDITISGVYSKPSGEYMYIDL